MKKLICFLVLLFISIAVGQDIKYITAPTTTTTWNTLTIGGWNRLAGFEIPGDINSGTKNPTKFTFLVGRSSADSLQVLVVDDAAYEILLTDPTTGSYTVVPEYFYMWKYVRPVPDDTASTAVITKWIFEPILGR